MPVTTLAVQIWRPACAPKPRRSGVQPEGRVRVCDHPVRDAAAGRRHGGGASAVVTPADDLPVTEREKAWPKSTPEWLIWVPSVSLAIGQPSAPIRRSDFLPEQWKRLHGDR